MTAYIRNPLTYAWAFLTLITVVSWWISRDLGVQHEASAIATTGVLLIAALKVHFVLRYFMELRGAPPWLRRVTAGWLLLLLALLFAFYGKVI